jgi:LytS/YehU family sensor histidine kinase
MPWRIWLAFALAPPVACAVTSAVLPIFAQRRLTWNSFSSSMTLTLAVAAAATILLAIPTYLVLRRRRRVGAIHCILSGLVIGLLGGGAIGGAVGLLAGVFFWLIGIWRNEDAQGNRASAA